MAAREQELNAREARLLAEELSMRRRLDELEAPQGPTRRDSVDGDPERCVLFVPTVEGYRLVPLEVAPPRVGDRVELEGEAFDVLRVRPVAAAGRRPPLRVPRRLAVASLQRWSFSAACSS